MSYKLTKSDGTLLTTVADFTADTSSTSISLLGRGVVNYSSLIGENFLYMLENFSSPTAPNNPIVGQIWFQTEDNTDSANPQTMMIIKVYTGNTSEGSPPGWKQVGGTNSSATAPTKPYTGELWYDSKGQTLYVWNGSEWQSVSGTLSQNAPTGPNGTSPADGTKWIMMPEHMEWVYDSSIISPEPPFKRIGGDNDGEQLTGSWRLIGPDAPQNTGTYNQYMAIQDTSGATHGVVAYYQNGNIVYVESGTDFTANAGSIPNFMTHGSPSGSLVIQPGINLNDTYTGTGGASQSSVINGSTTNALNFKDLAATEFLGRGDTWLPTTPAADNVTDFGSAASRWKTVYSSMFYAGSSTNNNPDIARVNLFGKAASAAQADKLTNPISINVTGDTIGKATSDGSGDFNLSTSLSPDLQNQLKNMAAGITKAQSTADNAGNTANNALTQDIADGRYIKLTGTGAEQVSGNLGASVSNCFDTIYANTFRGVATGTDYSDLAEYYQSDAEYLYGTLVKIGGGAEITQTTDDKDPEYFGVISHQPGVIMNQGKAEVAGYLPVVLSGRVPVRVTGKVNKGDRLVPSKVPGVAISVGTTADILKLDEATREQVRYATIGRALASSDILEEKYVECYIQSN